MKEIAELNFPGNVRYSESHEWIEAAGETARLGITDYAQDQLGDIVFVELPDVGETFEKGAEFGTVESVKAVSELYMPVDCRHQRGAGRCPRAGQQHALFRWLDDRGQAR